MDEQRILSVERTLARYQAADGPQFSGAVLKAWQRATGDPDSRPELRLRLILSTDLQLLGLYFSRPELQHLAISLLLCDSHLQLIALTERARDLIEDLSL